MPAKGGPGPEQQQGGAVVLSHTEGLGLPRTFWDFPHLIRKAAYDFFCQLACFAFRVILASHLFPRFATVLPTSYLCLKITHT